MAVQIHQIEVIRYEVVCDSCGFLGEFSDAECARVIIKKHNIVIHGLMAKEPLSSGPS